MQITITHKQLEKKFEPFTLTIQIESRDELATIWSLFGANAPHKRREHLDDRGKFKGAEVVDLYDVYEMIDDEAIRQGVK